MAWGSNLKWIQNMGGWASAKVLLDTYGHFLPTETDGYADVLTRTPDGPIRTLAEAGQFGKHEGRAKSRAPKRTSVVAQGRIELPTRGFSVRCSTN